VPRPKRPIPLERLTVMTMAEVGARLGITAQRVSQLEKSAFRKIGLQLIARRVVQRRWRHWRIVVTNSGHTQCCCFTEERSAL
jgi:hypothetical protein